MFQLWFECVRWREIWTKYLRPQLLTNIFIDKKKLKKNSQDTRTGKGPRMWNDVTQGCLRKGCSTNSPFCDISPPLSDSLSRVCGVRPASFLPWSYVSPPAHQVNLMSCCLSPCVSKPSLLVSFECKLSLSTNLIRACTYPYVYALPKMDIVVCHTSVSSLV